MNDPIIKVIPETAKVGETLELVAETGFPFLSGLAELRIYYRLGRRATTFVPATVVSGEPSQMTAVIEPEANDLACDARLWAWGRGTGTVKIRIGKTNILRILAVDA